jgi:hypothetical protein
MRTWHIETAVVAIVLATVAIASGGGPLELVGAGAVVLSFGHASIGSRLAEREAARAVVTVECHRNLVRYFVGKEVLWAGYFVAHGSWSALAGVALFLAYPVWRRWWRARHPLRPETSL